MSDKEIHFKNKLIISLDTSKTPSVEIGHPEDTKKPENNAEAAGMLKDDMTTLTEGILAIMQVAHLSGYQSVDKSLEEVTKHMTDAVAIMKQQPEKNKVEEETKKEEKLEEDNSFDDDSSETIEP